MLPVPALNYTTFFSFCTLPVIEALRNQVTSVPSGADVGFTCKSTTDAVWIRESSTSFVETKFLSQGAEPFDEQIDLNKYSFGKKGNKYSLIIKDVQLSDAGKCNTVGYERFASAMRALSACTRELIYVSRECACCFVLRLCCTCDVLVRSPRCMY